MVGGCVYGNYTNGLTLLLVVMIATRRGKLVASSSATLNGHVRRRYRIAAHTPQMLDPSERRAWDEWCASIKRQVLLTVCTYLRQSSVHPRLAFVLILLCEVQA